MTEVEMLKIEDMLQANYQFLDFSNSVLHETWFEMLQRFDFVEVREGVKSYMAAESKTPTVHDLLEHIRPIREKNIENHEHNVRVMFQNAVRCTDCNDYGYVQIIYPSGYEAIRPCDCQAGHQRFGKHVFEKMGNEDMPVRQKMMLFGIKSEKEFPEEIRKYRIVKYKPGTSKEVVTWRWEKT